MRKLCAVSIDVDEIPNYFAIHGLPGPPGEARATHAAFDRALPRAAAFARAHGLPLTLFAVGVDLARPENARTLRALAEEGHAVENHSYGHRYDLTRIEAPEIRAEVARGIEAITAATGRRPMGFRAPGYTVDERVFDALDELDVAFDSSVFPCPPYYLAKAAAMAGMRLRGRASRAVLDTPRVLLAPRRPYRPARGAWSRPAHALRGPEGGRRFVELPIQVTPFARLPLIGTLLGLAGARFASALAWSCAGEALVNLELHAIDFLDATDGLEALVGYQPELRVPVAARLDALAAALSVLARHGHAFVTLAEAARAFR
jgi:peptidoglycan-N-acetylglucosamine deacetylase